MATLDKSLDPKILSAAKEEFLKKGFEKASLREICKNAGVSTGAVYTRYNSKEELFEELVKDTLLKIDEKFNYDKTDQIYVENTENVNNIINQVLSNIDLEPVVNFIYDNFIGFQLLINCSNGSIYSDFLHSFVGKSEELFFRFFQNTDTNNLYVDKEEIHLMLTTFWTAIFEVLKHNFNREKAISYCNVLSQFFNWNAIIKTK